MRRGIEKATAYARACMNRRARVLMEQKRGPANEDPGDCALTAEREMT